MADCRWYSLNTKLKTEDHPPVPLAEGLALVRRYHHTAGQRLTKGEEALAASMFGFSKSQDNILEICFTTPASIQVSFSCRRDNPSWLQRLFQPIYQAEREVTLAVLEALLADYYTMPRENFYQRMKALPY